MLHTYPDVLQVDAAEAHKGHPQRWIQWFGTRVVQANHLLNTIQSIWSALWQVILWQLITFLSSAILKIISTAFLTSPPRSNRSLGLPARFGDVISSLWCDPAVKEAVRRSRELQLNYSTLFVYYFDSIECMVSPLYLLTDRDILHSSVKTIGITATNFKTPMWRISCSISVTRGQMHAFF